MNAVRKSRRLLPPLASQMAVCDANYIRLLRLLPDLQPGALREIMIPGAGEGQEMRFVLRVSEGFKYTSGIEISQLAPEACLPYYRRPEMQVRLYHDANAAEVIAYQNHRYFRTASLFPECWLYQPAEKQQLNIFLAEWLTLCLTRGHSPDTVYTAPCTS